MPMDNSSFTFRRSLRLSNFDYSQSGAYFVTLCSHENNCIFGEIAEGEMRINSLGIIVKQQWQRTAKVRKNVDLDAFVIMPNHLHGILLLHDAVRQESISLRNDRSKKRSTTLQAGSLGAIIGQFKSAVTRLAKSTEYNRPLPIWQRNYYEHIIRSEESLNEIRKYIVKNPARWAEDHFYAK